MYTQKMVRSPKKLDGPKRVRPREILITVMYITTRTATKVNVFSYLQINLHASTSTNRPIALP